MRFPLSHTALVDARRALAEEAASPRRSAAAARRATAAGAGAADVSMALPALVEDRLRAIALLHDVPFGYLVPDLALLPPESLRLFRVNEEWVRATQAGLLSVAEDSTSDTAARAAAPGFARTGTLTGFALRTRLVAENPGLQVRAYDAAGVQLEPVRIERPAAGTLLVIVAGVLDAVHIEEPHHGLRLGVGSSPSGDVVRVRRGDGVLATSAAGAAVEVPVPTRAGAPPGVLDVAELARRITRAAAPGAPPATGPAALALHLLQPAVRQRFTGASP